MPSHHAPAVSYPVGRSRFLASLMLGLWLLAALVTLAWWHAAASPDPRPWWGLASLLLAAVAAILGWRRAPQGLLSWDGQGWTWQSAGYPSGTAVTELAPLLDLQRLVLIRMRNPADASWLVWADATADAGRWLDLRRALRAHAHFSGEPPPTV